MTYLEVVNAVLRRMREDPVASSDDSEYSRLVRQFINEAKEDIESAWDWTRLRHSIVIDTEPGESRYVANCIDGRERVLEVLDLTNKTTLTFGRWADQNRLIGFHPDTQGPPLSIDRNGFDAIGNTIFEVYPVPNGVYKIVINAVIPQAEYLDSGIDTSQVEIPAAPLVLGAYLRATEERGDDASSQYRFNLEMFQKSLHNAIATDEAQLDGESGWEVD